MLSESLLDPCCVNFDLESQLVELLFDYNKPLFSTSDKVLHYLIKFCFPLIFKGGHFLRSIL